MDTLFIILGAAVLFVLVIRAANRRDKKNDQILSEMKQKLQKEVQDVSLLVAKNCPDNEEAHKLVMDATQCLVIPNSRLVIGPGQVQSRYQQGFDALSKARKLAEPTTDKS